MMSKTVIALIALAIIFLVIANIVIWGTILRPGRQQAQQTTVPRTPAPANSKQPTPTTQAPRTATPRPSSTATQAAAKATGTAAGKPATATATRPNQSPTATAARPQPTATPALLTTVDAVVEAVDAKRSGARFRLVFTEQDIQTEVSAYLQGTGDITFSDVKVDLQPGVAVITGKARVLAFNVGFTARTTVVVDNGRVRLKVIGLDLLGGLVPGFVKDRLIAMIEESADLPLLAGLPVKIERVDIELGQAVGSGVVL